MLTAGALAAAWIVSQRIPDLSRPDTLSDLGHSPAYLFGFAHAALTGCNVEAGTGFPGLEAKVGSRADGAVPDDVKRGFAAFAEIAGSKGADSAGRHAEFLFGAGSRINPNVLMPRR